MSLNIKNEEICRLANELARLTGETMTGAITVALHERLQREKRRRSVCFAYALARTAGEPLLFKGDELLPNRRRGGVMEPEGVHGTAGGCGGRRGEECPDVRLRSVRVRIASRLPPSPANLHG